MSLKGVFGIRGSVFVLKGTPTNREGNLSQLTIREDVVDPEGHVKPEKILRLFVGDLAELGTHFSNHLRHFSHVEEAKRADQDV